MCFARASSFNPHDLNDPIDPDEAERIGITGGRHLIDWYWGRYVAVVRSPEVAVIRDPTGGLPCFETSWRGVRCLFSDIQACLSLGLLQFSINWKYVASFVAYSALQIRETGLREIAEVQPGERITFDRDSMKRELLWSPAQIASTDRIEDHRRAIEAVRSTVEQCVHAWASLHRSLILNLSGGLDSSIVLACLLSAPNRPPLTCLHYYAPGSNEDEREFARLASRGRGAELVECALDPEATRLEALADIRPFPKPWFYLYDLIHSPVEAALLKERGATSVFSGAGGDGLFVQARADLAIADFLSAHGFTPGVLRVALGCGTHQPHVSLADAGGRSPPLSPPSPPRSADGHGRSKSARSTERTLRGERGR